MWSWRASSGAGRGPGTGSARLGGGGEDVGVVGVGAAGQGDVGVLAVLGAGDHRQAGVDGAALGGVVGDRVAKFGIFVPGEQEVTVGPAALPGARIGVQRPAHDQPVSGDGLDAEQVAVGQHLAGLPRLDAVVVAGADDRSPRLAFVPSPIVTAGPFWTMPRAMRSSRMRRDSSRRSAWSAAISSVSVPLAGNATEGAAGAAITCSGSPPR